MGLLHQNMGCYQVALLVALALVLQNYEIQAGECSQRSTFIQIRIPQRTKVSIKYPKEINPVQFVPFPYNPSGSECTKCQGTSCTKCTYTKNDQSFTSGHSRQTNIIINIRGTKPLNDSITTTDSKYNDTSSATVDGTIVGVYDKTWAASVSGASAKVGDAGNSSAAVASGTALSQSDVLAALNEEQINKANGEVTHQEDIYVVSEDLSTANANSTSASDDGSKNTNQTLSDKSSATEITEEDCDDTPGPKPANDASPKNGVATTDSSQPTNSGKDKSSNPSTPKSSEASAAAGSDAIAIDKNKGTSNAAGADAATAAAAGVTNS